MPEKKVFYLKFKIDTEVDLLEKFIISDDGEKLAAWEGESERIDEKVEFATESKKPKIHSFASVSFEFQRTIDIFKATVPFIMAAAPTIRRLVDDKNLRGFAKEKGKLFTSSVGFETYEIPLDLYTEVRKNLLHMHAVLSGEKKLPELFLVGLISSYDVFLSDLIKSIYYNKPEILSSSESQISFKDLMSFGSVEVARERVIEKEVEGVIRRSHVEQIQWLEKKLEMTLTKELKIWPKFIEICERRNLLAHTGGKVSSQYINNCNQHGLEINNLKVGDQLTIDQKYYLEAVNIIHELGHKLTQVIWRKILPNEIQNASKQLSEMCYDLIYSQNYAMASTLLKFGLDLKKQGNDATRKMMVINYANSEKLQGRDDQSIRILESEDWTAATENYQICVAAIRDNREDFFRLMRRVAASGAVKAQGFREWPVFNRIRSDREFIQLFEELFEQKLVLDREENELTPNDGNIDSGSKQSDPAISPDENGTVH